MRVTCHKCKSPNAWVRKTDHDLLMICWCGYQRVLMTILQDKIDGPLEDEPGDDEEQRLPKAGTHLHKTLMVLSIMPYATSAEVTTRVNELNGMLKVPGRILRKDLVLTVSDVSSYLTMLRGKNLVERAEIKRGVPGGSTWYLTESAWSLLEVGE